MVILGSKSGSVRASSPLESNDAPSASHVSTTMGKSTTRSGAGSTAGSKTQSAASAADGSKNLDTKGASKTTERTGPYQQNELFSEVVESLSVANFCMVEFVYCSNRLESVAPLQELPGCRVTTRPLRCARGVSLARRRCGVGLGLWRLRLEQVASRVNPATRLGLRWVPSNL